MLNKTLKKPSKPLPDTDKYLDKRFVKKICSIIYYCGLGNCWYEKSDSFNTKTFKYKFWFTICNVYLFLTISSEFGSNFRTDLTPKESNDALLFSLAHPTIYLKVLFLYFKRETIKKFFKTLIEETRLNITNEVELESLKKSRKFIIAEVITMYLCMFLTTVDGIKYHFKEDIPVRTLITAWPGRTDTGLIVNICRVFVQAFWWYIVTCMLALDSLCLASLILLGYRFKFLQIYFKNLKNIYLINPDKKPRDVLEQEFRDKFVLGVKLHSRTLWCSQSLQSALGNIYSVQIVQSIGLLAICLIKLVRLEKSITFLIANMSFILCMVVLTGCYMLAAGDITHEASLVSTSMFYSGWEFHSKGNKIRPLITVAIQCSNRPVIMTAFGIYDLSYRNFISVLRISYSFFAVMY